MTKRRKPRANRNRRLNGRAKSKRPVIRQNGTSQNKIKLLIKFLGVGLLNTFVGYAIYATLILLDIPYLVALLMATVAGVIFNYFSIGRLVFKAKGGLAIFAKFIATYGVVYLINASSLDVFIKYFKLNPYIGQALCVPISVLLSWFLMNYWVYKK